MRVLVCGGRDYRDREKVFAILDEINPDFLIEGGATGADNLAWSWSKRRNIPRLTIEADWARHGFGAGPIRNQRMIDEGKPDLVVAFQGGAGTADMIRRAKRAGIEVREVNA